jgi:hypothetical protein
VRASLNQPFKNAFQHRFRTLKHFVVPESNHAKSQTSKSARTLEVFKQSIRVLPAIELDDQSRPDAHEIPDKSADQHLSAEPIAAQPAMPQVIPKTSFGVGRVRA